MVVVVVIVMMIVMMAVVVMVIWMMIVVIVVVIREIIVRRNCGYTWCDHCGNKGRPPPPPFPSAEEHLPRYPIVRYHFYRSRSITYFQHCLSLYTLI
ncbi:hypothetical protein PUN28_004799 [Cardiocondyla obscurior]|uniref:Uncharacterized protein n=1 Tax=Cardiocondyla obscurior TaxID=286306 RepID=A0AAW2GHS5_9HYME